MNINLKFLRPSRKRLLVGDVFVLQPAGHPFYFGRVIRLDAMIRIFKNCILVYIYNATSDDKANIPRLSKFDLLIPPKMINRLGWSRGYFETVANIPLCEDEIIWPHCFKDPLGGGYRDEYNHVLPHRFEPCGFYALGNFRTLDDEVSKALGIPLAPD